MFKKTLKIVAIIFIVLVVALVSIPYLFEDKIKEMIAETINKNVDAKVSFEDVNLSLFKSFPQANVTVDKLSIINKAPFEGDTLVFLNEINLKMSVKELFKDKNEGMNIESIYSSNALINIIFDENGVGNFDIALKEETEKIKILLVK